MDAVTAFAPRRSEALPSMAAVAAPDPHTTLAVTATYRLSEDGRKASLLAGGNGKALQQLTVNVPVSRLHLVSIDAEGTACLKLRPRYDQITDQKITRVDDVPTYDVPPTIEELFREAARNYQLERTYEAERRAARQERQDAYHERRATLAKAFLADPAQRALVHPAPSPHRCYLAGDNGRRVLFDSNADVGVTRDVPAEAHRRFRADLRTRRQRNLQDRAAQLALHEVRKQVLADFIAQHGTADQRSRQEAGVLPMQEAIEAFTDHAFAALGNRPQYVRDGVDAMQAQVRRIPEYTNAVVMRGALTSSSTDVSHMTAAQWALVNEYRRLLPDATVTLRQHKIGWKRPAGNPPANVQHRGHATRPTVHAAPGVRRLRVLIDCRTARPRAIVPYWSLSRAATNSDDSRSPSHATLPLRRCKLAWRRLRISRAQPFFHDDALRTGTPTRANLVCLR
jgi:hypothetical protein